MAYNADLDRTFWRGKIGNLRMSIVQYNGGEPKLNIGPREIQTGSGKVIAGKAGRLMLDELQFIAENLDEMKRAAEKEVAK